MRPVQERGARPAVGASDSRDRRTTTALLLGVAAAVLALDQLTKWLAVRTLDDRTIDLFWTVRLNLTFNRGGSFGLGQSFGPFIALGGVVVVLLLMNAGRLAPSRGVTVAIGLLLGGALGNLSDRVFRAGEGLLGGAVIDFVDFQWWPIFNVADTAIVIGGILLLFASRGIDDQPSTPTDSP